MEIIDAGLTHPDALITLLRAYNGGASLIDKITHIENHKGNWIIKSYTTITSSEIIYTISEFNKYLSYDGIIEFWIGDKLFEDVAGTTQNSNNISKLLTFAN